jgi:phosphate transport system substrate-binding protein
VTGAGSTFDAPFFNLAFPAYQQAHPSVAVNYASVGSSAGITRFTARQVDFGATDVPLQPDEASAIPAPYIEFPTALGAVVIAYNVNGLQTGLKLDGPTAADIFLGKVTRWNDPEIAQQNPGVTLPNEPIQVVHRADESGTTAIFTGWLSALSPEWQSRVGAGKGVQWPVGTGGNGNAGVAGAMAQTEGAIGYLEYQYAVTSNFGVANIKAPGGDYVQPSVAGVTAAAGGLTFPISADTNILNSSTTGAYPISSTTYILIYKDQTNRDKAQTLVDFWTWALTTGQAELRSLNYAPLPSNVQRDALAQLAQITYQGKPVHASSGIGA